MILFEDIDRLVSVKGGDKVEFIEDLFTELNELGEAIWMITQSVSRIPKEILTFFSNTICFRLKGLRDVRVISDIHNLTNKQMDALLNLGRGEILIIN